MSTLAVKDASNNSVTLTLLPSVVVHGQKTVTTAGAAEALGASATLVRGVWLRALGTNTDSVFVGGATVTSANGFSMDTGEPFLFIATDNLANIYIDAAVNGEGVAYIGS